MTSGSSHRCLAVAHEPVICGFAAALTAGAFSSLVTAHQYPTHALLRVRLKDSSLSDPAASNGRNRARRDALSKTRQDLICGTVPAARRNL